MKLKKDYWEAQRRKEKAMEKLISIALERFDADKLLTMLFDVCDKTQTEYLTKEMMFRANLMGIACIKCENILQVDKVQELGEQIFPYHYDQQTNLFI